MAFTEFLLAFFAFAFSFCRDIPELTRAPEEMAGTPTLANGIKSQDVLRAAGAGVEVLSIDRFVLRCRDSRAVLVGFAAFTDAEIRKAVVPLARTFEE